MQQKLARRRCAWRLGLYPVAFARKGINRQRHAGRFCLPVESVPVELESLDPPVGQFRELVLADALFNDRIAYLGVLDDETEAFAVTPGIGRIHDGRAFFAVDEFL